MTTNVTIRMDKELLRQVRHRAVDEHLSTSRWITKILQEVTAAENEKAPARQRALRRLERGFNLGGKPLDREQLHER